MNTRNRKFLSILFSLLVFTVSFASVAHAQDAAAAAATPAAGEKAPAHNKTLWTVLQEGGAIMIPIGLVSVGMCSLIVLGFLTLRRKKLVPDEHVEALRKFFMNGDYQGAVEYCRQNPGVFTDTVYTGLLCVGQGKEMTERAMEDTLAKGIASASTRNYYLNLIGVVTPMLGLTGTVLGMMRAFLDPGHERHRRSGRAGGVHRRGARGDGERSLHRDPGLYVLLRVPQLDHGGDGLLRGSHQHALPRHALP